MAASIKGARTRTGPSCAAPFGTAVALRGRLRRAACDLGPDRPDAIFGAGLIARRPRAEVLADGAGRGMS